MTFRPPGRTTPRRGTPSLPSLAIPAALPHGKSPLTPAPRIETADGLLTAFNDVHLSTTSGVSATESFNADLRRVLGSDGSASPVSSNSRELPTSLSTMAEEDWREAFEKHEIEYLGRLGEGAGGSVDRCRLKGRPTFAVFALKTIPADPNPVVQRQILRELSFNKSCCSQYIAEYYGAYSNEKEGVICIAMEYCEGGSLDALYKQVKQRGGRTGEKVLGRIAKGVLEGLSYLYQRKIIHRDVKPSNILLTKEGEVKLCDFGVSGELVNSLAGTFTGTSYYMAPERIQGQSYTVTSDVWSLGLTLMEVSMNRFPFLESDTSPLMPLELLSIIVSQDPPTLNDEPEAGVKWSNSYRHFLQCCLERDRLQRPSPRQMLEHPWIVGITSKRVNMAKWISEVWM